jgi:hypothetical protein
MAAELDDRIDALIALDVILPRTIFGARVRTPFLLMRTDGEGYPPGWNEVMVAPFASLDDVGYDVIVQDARHQSFSDRPFQRPERFGEMAGRVAEIIFLYVRTFLERHLNGTASGPPIGESAPPGVSATLHQ